MKKTKRHGVTPSSRVGRKTGTGEVLDPGFDEMGENALSLVFNPWQEPIKVERPYNEEADQWQR